MIVLPEKPRASFDVDDTLIIIYASYMKKKKPKGVEPIMECGNTKIYPHIIHIDMLKEFKMRGITIEVWSQAGVDWAEKIVYKLGLEKWVDLVGPKPTWICDDRPIDFWLPESARFYKEHIS